MNTSQNKILIILSFSCLLAMSGCTTFQIVDLKPQTQTTSNLTHSIHAAAGVETMQIDAGEYRDADKWQQGLAETLRNEGVFESVSYPFVKKDQMDLLIRGRVGGDFRNNKAKNFFTWWPGSIIFAHNWRGSCYLYDAHADVEVIEARTGKVLGQYHAESSHELIHKSANPVGPFLAGVTIIPGMIKGGMSASPRDKYRQQMYEVAYPNLWKKLAIQIAQDQSKIHARKMQELKAECGKHFNAPPVVGMAWPEYEYCQTKKFKLVGKEPMDTGIVSIYMSDDKSLRIHVNEQDEILRWYIPRKRKRPPSGSIY